MKITSIEKNKRSKDRFSVYIDNRFSFSISEDDYLSLNLYDKSVLSQVEIDYIKNTINFRAAKNCALRFLSYKLRTEKEVRIKLHDDGFDGDSIEMAINELKALGYINNKIYVQKYVFDRSKLKPKSKKLIKFELLGKGIQEEIIDEVLNDWNVDERSVAESLVKRKFGKYDFNDDNVKRKAYMFLKHRGYSHDVIESVIGRVE
ncbi:MAG: regulatory protein RecX [Ruminiclostridium sp.]|nr:regulatory protein RecX [Ruminiclostridium sp.]